MKIESELPESAGEEISEESRQRRENHRGRHANSHRGHQHPSDEAEREHGERQSSRAHSHVHENQRDDREFMPFEREHDERIDHDGGLSPEERAARPTRERGEHQDRNWERHGPHREVDLAHRLPDADATERADRSGNGVETTESSATAPATPLILRLWLLMAVVFLTCFVYFSSGGIGPRTQAFCGIFVILGLVALFSKNLMAVNWQPIFFGFTLQILLALFILKFEINNMEGLGIPDGFRPGYALFEWIAGFFRLFLDFAQRGASFVFGALVQEDKIRAVFGRGAGPIFALSVLPTIIFVSSFFTILYYFGILQFVVRIFSRGMMALLGTSGAETLSAVANVFMGQIEAPLVIKPYLAKMTNSELLAVMVGGMATISGSLMAIYIGFGADSVAILTTSVMAAPCSLYLSKLLLPETEKPVTVNMVKTVEDKKHRNVIDAATDGAGEGMKLAINIIAMLIAFIALIELVNTALRYFPTNTSLPNWLAATDDPTVDGAPLFWMRLRNYVSTLIGYGIVVWVLRWPFQRALKLLKLDDEYRDWKHAAGLVRYVPTLFGYFLFLGAVDILMRTLPADLTLGAIFSSLFYPLALLMGIEEKDAGRVASLLGTKLATNEFVAFLDLKTVFADHEISPRSFRLATYALTGFANFASIGIQLGGIGAMAPERRPDLARLGMAALFVGFLVTILNAAIAGVLLPAYDMP